jgi:8-oxo-dGTP pyrophosphatase MutT (NUDIX family)
LNSRFPATGNSLSAITAPTSIKGVLLVDARVVLVHNARDEWELPGGRAEPGEDPERTLAREFTEELAISVRPGEQIDSYLFEVIPGRHVFIITYGCTLIGEFRPAISEEHTDYCLWPVDRLSELKLPFGYKRSIEAWAKAI